MAIPAQGQFDAVLGYSLKRDYSGDALNWRNIETFNLEIIITDFINANNVHAATGKNFLSTYLLDEVAKKLKVDKNNTSIKSIEVPASPESLVENQIQAGKYLVTAEVKSGIDSVTLLAQHPELNEATGAESGKFYGVKDALFPYSSEIVSISETFDFQDKEDGGGEFSHNVDLTLKRPDYCKQCEDGAWEDDSLNFVDEATCRTYYNCPSDKSTSANKSVAINIASILFDHDYQNTYFGHNAFSGALQNFGLTGVAANKQYFTESYDTLKNTFSFSKKMVIEPETQTQTGVTIGAKIAIDFGRDGRVTVGQTLDFKSRNGNWAQMQAAVFAERDAAYTNCSAHLSNYDKEIAGRGTNSVGALLSQTPLTQTITWDKMGLKATLSSQFSNDIQVSPLNLILGKGAQFLETVNLSKDHKGIVTATYNVTLTSHAPRSELASGDNWTYAFCDVAGKCMLSDGTRNNGCTVQWDCENVCGLCSLPGTGPGQSQQACEAATDGNGNPGVWTPGVWTAWDTEVLCEDDNATWTYGKTPIDLLRDYETTAEEKVSAAIAYGRNPAGTADLSFEGVFWNTLDHWSYPTGGFTTNNNITGKWRSLTAGDRVTCISTQASSQVHGKTFTLTKTFTNDVTYRFHNLDLRPTVNDAAILRVYCPDCFNKVDTKWNDVWPKRVVNEHIIIDRGDGFIKGTPKEGTSVLADAYHTLPGKRTATVNAVRKRSVDGNMLTSPEVPKDELTALAHHLRVVLMQVFLHPKCVNSWQTVFYLSNLSYTYDSEYNVSMTAEITYTYKKPKPN